MIESLLFWIKIGLIAGGVLFVLVVGAAIWLFVSTLVSMRNMDKRMDQLRKNRRW